MFGVHAFGAAYFGQALGEGEVDLGEPPIAIVMIDVAPYDREIVVPADDRVIDVPPTA